MIEKSSYATPNTLQRFEEEESWKTWLKRVIEVRIRFAMRPAGGSLCTELRWAMFERNVWVDSINSWESMRSGMVEARIRRNCLKVEEEGGRNEMRVWDSVEGVALDILEKKEWKMKRKRLLTEARICWNVRKK